MVRELSPYSGLALSKDPKIKIVPMKRRHLKQVLAIENEIISTPWSKDLFLGELNLSNRSYWVAKTRRKILGYGGLMMSLEDGHITTLTVSPLWRRKKIATALLLKLARQAIKYGACNLTLEVRVSNKAAQNLYYQFGFAPAGIRPNYYSGNKEDALIMWAEDVNKDNYKSRLDRIEASIERMPISGYQ